MKYKVLAVSTGNKVNIGDYIQALASSQFIPSLDGFIQREYLKDYNEEECKVIMNGWYMHNPKQWPPSNKIKPLFVALHFNSLAKNILLSTESLEYLKKHEPIGCRDTYTSNLLKERGVNAYFSGCMTLTLGYKFKSNVKNDKCYFVDPFFVTNWNVFSVLKSTIYLIFHWRPLTTIAYKYPEDKSMLRKMFILTTFYREYKKIFTKETLINAEYICQQNKHYKEDFDNEIERLKEAERLIKEYAKASLVVTSRIHCALPCLGLETPVIYTEDVNQSEVSTCRFGGLKELFNIIRWENGSLTPEFEFQEKISIKNKPKNKEKWRDIARNLINTCKVFIDDK